MISTRQKVVGVGLAGIVLLSVLLFIYLQRMANSANTFIDPSDQTLVLHGKQVYLNNCAACHGANLEGQPNWRTRLENGRLPAPPHDATGHTWHHPDAVLFDIVKNGLVPGVTAPADYQSDMPAYGRLLTDRDIVAVLAYIKSIWPAEALAAQKEVTQESSGQ